MPKVQPRDRPESASFTSSCFAPNAAPIVLLGTLSKRPFKNLSSRLDFPTELFPRSTTFSSMLAGAGLFHCAMIFYVKLERHAPN